MPTGIRLKGNITKPSRVNTDMESFNRYILAERIEVIHKNKKFDSAIIEANIFNQVELNKRWYSIVSFIRKVLVKVTVKNSNLESDIAFFSIIKLARANYSYITINTFKFTTY